MKIQEKDKQVAIYKDGESDKTLNNFSQRHLKGGELSMDIRDLDKKMKVV